ncbi:MAG: ABC transporter permease [Gemmatimonadaceae bacterium]
MDSLLQDLRFAARGLLRRPGFTAAVVATLALGIGANAAIFSVVNAVLLRPLPYGDPDRLVMVWGRYPDFGRTGTSLPDFTDWRAGTTGSFAEMAAWHGTLFNLTGQGEPEQLRADRVSANFFPALGVRPALGRGFLPEEEKVGGDDDVVVLSHALWQRRFAGDPRVVGQSIDLSGRKYTVVGVAPRGFRFFQDVDLWAPLRADTATMMAQRRSEYMNVFGRLRPGVSVERARADLAAVEKRLAAEYPQTNAALQTEVLSMKEDLVQAVRPALLVFSAAVGLVLLIACANVANLLLARAAAREREVAVRVALGAGRGRLVRQLLTESVLTALLGGAVGLLLAVWGVSALRAASPAGLLPRLGEVRIDPSVIAFALVLAVATGFLFGLAPALRLAGGALHDALKEGSRGASGGAVTRFRNALVLGEVAVAVVLLVGAGLLIRSFERLNRVDPGFQPANVLSYGVVLPRAKYGEIDEVPAVYARLLERTRGIPGVRAAAASGNLPMQGSGYVTFAIEGGPERTQGQQTEDLQPFVVTPDYFRVLGIPLRRGRLIEARDVAGAPRVAVINEEMARRYFAGRDPLGLRVTFGDPADTAAAWYTVVGVVGDVAQEGLTARPYAQLYRALDQVPQRSVWISMRTAGDPMAVAGAARAALGAVDPQLPLNDLRTMEDRIAQDIARPRVSVALLACFSAVALVLAAIGIYGVVAYTVAQRTREIGIRMALGARPDGVLRLVLRQGLAPVAAGVGVGLAASLAATRVMHSLLYGVSATDPLTFVAVALFLGAVALAATWLPARRATRVDPLAALRYE